MAIYTYKVVAPDGKIKKGTIESKSLERATEKLQSEGFTITDIKEQGVMNKEISFNIGTHISPRDLSVFCSQFVSILNAGVTVITALDMLAEQTENKVFGKALKEVQASVEKGESLGGAMKMHPKIFPQMLINMVVAGESSGNLEVAFQRMAVHFEKDNRLKAQIKKAMIYPIMVMAVAVVVIVVMLTVVVPNFTAMFADMDMDLPAATQLLVNMSNYLKTKWYVVLIVVVAIVVAIKLFMSTETGVKLWAKAMIKMPLIGNLTVKSSAARFSRTLSTLLAAGIPLIDAIENVSKVMSNKIVQEGLMDAKTQVMRGVPLSKPMKDMGIFPPMLVHMTRIGEETGNMESMLEKVADFFDEEVENATESLTAAMEPLIIVVLAGIVGFIIMAVMSPMLSMYSGVENM